MKRSQPPTLATWLMERTRTDVGIIGDLAEEYANGRTAGWYWKQALVAASPAAIRAFRWFAALPAALLAAMLVPEIVLAFPGIIPSRLEYGWGSSFIAERRLSMVMHVSLVFFFMSATFVGVGVGMVPARKASVARIALTVVFFWAASPLVLEPLRTSPMVIGLWIALGGLAGYLPWRRRLSAA